MIQRHTLQVPPLPLDTADLAYFRFGDLPPASDGTDRVILTNEIGEWQVLDRSAFHALLSGTLTDDATRSQLAAKGMLLTSFDADGFSAAVRRRKKHVGLGPSRHVLRLTDPAGTPMPVEVAKAVIDHAMLSTASALTLVLDAPGAVPLDLLGFLHQYGTEKNRYEGKTIRWILTAPAGIDAAAAVWLADHRFIVRFTVLGPAAFHDAHAAALGLPSHADLTAAASALREAATARRRAHEIVEAVVPLRADSPSPADLVATLADLGVQRCRAVPVLVGDHALSPEAAAAALDAFAAAALAAGNLAEDTVAAVVAAATRTDPGLLSDTASPRLDTVAYSPAGHIVASAAALDASDPSDMVLGVAGEASYKDVVHHPLRRAMALASLTECLPGLSDHWAAPYVGVDAVETWARTGDLFPKPPSDPAVQTALALAGLVLARLAAPDLAEPEALRAWIR